MTTLRSGGGGGGGGKQDIDDNGGGVSTKSPGFNFINNLQAAFMRADPESAKKTDNLTVFFMLLGSACIKAARKMFVKLTPGLRF